MDFFYFLHGFIPNPIILTIGPFSFYWYGLLIALGIIVALLIAQKLAALDGLAKETLFDLGSWLIVAGLIGARLYDVFLELPYYLNHPLDVFKIYQGGLAIHGALLGGLIALLIFTHFKKINLWRLLAVLAPGVALGQAIGRWGNWFNQELFGRPTNLPWSIPISPLNRPFEFEAFTYFHPTFLYESLALIILFFILFYFAQKKISAKLITASYLIGYGLTRGLLEFIKIDTTPIVFGLRWPQIFSLIMIVVGFYLLFSKNKSEV